MEWRIVVPQSIRVISDCDAGILRRVTEAEWLKLSSEPHQLVRQAELKRVRGDLADWSKDRVSAEVNRVLASGEAMLLWTELRPDSELRKRVVAISQCRARG